MEAKIAQNLKTEKILPAVSRLHMNWNYYFYVPQKKENHIGLEIGWTNPF